MNVFRLRVYFFFREVMMMQPNERSIVDVYESVCGLDCIKIVGLHLRLMTPVFPEQLQETAWKYKERTQLLTVLTEEFVLTRISFILTVSKLSSSCEELKLYSLCTLICTYQNLQAKVSIYKITDVHLEVRNWNELSLHTPKGMHRKHVQINQEANEHKLHNVP